MVPDSNGLWKAHPEEPRLMVRREPTEVGGEYFRVLPEIILTLVATLIMFLEAVFSDRQKSFFGPLAVGGLIASLVASIAAYGDPGPAFHNLLNVDGFATFFRI